MDNKFYFMDNTNYDQIEIGSDIISEEQSKYLKENLNIIIQLYETNPVSIILPDHVTFKVLEGYDKKGLSLSGVLFNLKSNDSITAIYEKNSFKFDDIANVLKKNNIKILDIATEDGDLEDVFVQLTNH